jgi:hypothetical protein
MLFFAGYFWSLGVLARRQGTNLDRLGSLRVWTAVQLSLFLIFLVLVYTLDSGFMTIYGAVYLLSLGLAFVVTIQMRQTVEGIGQLVQVGG